MKKVLFISTYGDFLATFELSNIMLLQEMGCQVHCASNFEVPSYNRKTYKLDEIRCQKHNIDFDREPFNIKKNITLIDKIIKLLRKEDYDIIDCHNAVAGVLTRIASKRCKIRNVIYTPHSFFFYKGCPIKNLIFYKSIETFMAKYTDILISINQEDYASSKKMPLRGNAIYIPGVGVDVEKIRMLPIKRKEYCDEFCIRNDSTIFISVGELITRKNHICALEAFSKANLTNSYFIICGFGELESYLKEQAVILGIADKVIFTGFRSDAKEIMKASDIFVFPSLQEGLSVALMEAMACGLPALASEIRGNVDLIDAGKGGVLFDLKDPYALSKAMITLSCDIETKRNFGTYNTSKIENYDCKSVKKIMKNIYSELLISDIQVN